MKYVVFACILFVSVTSAMAQSVDRVDLDQATRSNSLGVAPVSSPFSLIDMSRVHWSHSYSLSYFSGTSYSGSIGLLNTTMLYNFSPKISLAVNLALAHNAGSIWGDGNNSATVLPGFILDYHPSENFRFSFGMQTYSGGLYLQR